MKERQVRILLAAGGVGVVGGLAMAGAANATLGGVLVLTGWLCLVFALHRFGRLGTH